MPHKHKRHACTEKYTIETTVSGVKEIWIVYDVEEGDIDEVANIVYDIKYCPFCGRKLDDKK